MFLRSAHIRHYKSLDDVDLRFAAPITVLVGPNAVGKSNVVDALRFLRDAVAVDLEHAISSRGGIGRVRQYSRTKPFAVNFRLELDLDPLGTAGSAAANYELSIQSHQAGNYSVSSERASWLVASRAAEVGPEQRAFRRGDDDVLVDPVSGHSWRVAPDQLVLGPQRFGVNDGAPIARFIKGWQFSALYPNMLRQPASPDKDKELSEDGRNWASVIKALKRTPRGRVGLHRLFEAMRSVIPDFEDVSVMTAGSYLVPRFRFRSSNSETIDFDPPQLSDGTLRIFGMLLALYQTPAPPLLVIEEPEQTVHPGVLGVLADAFREAGEQTQIVITTHSPHFMDHFRPEEVRVVTLKDGATHVAPIRKAQVEAVNRRLMSLQDFMLAEGLQPEEA